MTLKYKIGNKVRIKSIDWYNKNKDTDGFVHCGDRVFDDYMSVFCGSVVTIGGMCSRGYSVREDMHCRTWTDEMIEGLVEEESKPKDMGEVSDGYHTFNELYEYRMLYNAALFNEFAKQGLYDVHKSRKHSDGEYPFGDSNLFIVMAELPTGQISNHYEMKDWDLFQVPKKEKANVWDSHTPKDAAERVRMFLTPKPKYPQTYKECCKVLGIEEDLWFVYEDIDGNHINPACISNYRIRNLDLYHNLEKLRICRDAYWKIAGEEMGLGKPWEPDWEYKEEEKYTIEYFAGMVFKDHSFCCSRPFAFPTVEMRDTFYENFNKEIEQCKELL